MEDEYLSKCVVDPVKRTFYLYSNEGAGRPEAIKSLCSGGAQRRPRVYTAAPRGDPESIQRRATSNERAVNEEWPSNERAKERAMSESIGRAMSAGQDRKSVV